MTFSTWVIFKMVVEIGILWFIFYRMLVFFEGTRAFQVLKGLLVILLLFLISRYFGLDIINWLLTRIFGISIIGFIVIFQQEIRQGLARLGQQHLFNFDLEEAEVIKIIEEIAGAVYKLSKQKIGCLIALEREVKLNTYIESGVHVEAKVVSPLIQNIFMPKSPLHDGGIIIRGNRIMAASCLFPLTENPNFSKMLGTRHRAALGITEQTDAIVIIASEESGEISLASDGRFVPIVNKDRLVNLLRSLLVLENNKKKRK
ncbi:MAG: TIGR00159 family protein [Candidatus Omnitrophica bacterium]|nr:TIGR00159 family protein [Candidatus Omnitrophota bacterium]